MGREVSSIGRLTLHIWRNELVRLAVGSFETRTLFQVLKSSNQVGHRQLRYERKTSLDKSVQQIGWL